MSAMDEALELLERSKRVIRDGEERRRALQHAGDKAAAKAEEAVGGYPEASGKPLAVWYTRIDARGRAYKSKFKSAKQQRKVAALYAEGKIPYRRTGLLGRSLTSVAHVIADGVILWIGTHLKYAKFVWGDESVQSHYHRGTWRSLHDTLQSNKDAILQEFGDTLRGYLHGYVSKR